MFSSVSLLFHVQQGLKANVIVPFEEGHLMKSDFSVINEDSSNRKRSSSLTEQVRSIDRIYTMLDNTLLSYGYSMCILYFLPCVCILCIRN